MANKSYYNPHKEKEIETEIKQYISSLGGLCYKIHGGDLYQETGIPDLLCCVKGKFVGIEVKDPGGKPSAIQLIQGARIIDSGGFFLIAKRLKDVKDYFEERGII